MIENILEMKDISNFFRIPGHRLEKVLFHNKLRFFNDSKATNISATIFALQNLSDPFSYTRWRFKKSKISPFDKCFEKPKYCRLRLWQG